MKKELEKCYQKFLESHNLEDNKKARELWLESRKKALADYRPILSITVDKRGQIVDVKH